MTTFYNHTTSGVTLTSDFYMKNFYSANRNAVKTSYRKDYTKEELSYEDSRALKRALSKLSSYEYDDEDNSENIYNTIKAYVDTYNNTLDSSRSSSEADVKRYSKQLKALSDKYSNSLKDIGITVAKDGSLAVNENLLKAADMDKVKQVFSEDSDYLRKSSSITKRLNANTYDWLYAQLTGSGAQLNISL